MSNDIVDLGYRLINSKSFGIFGVVIIVVFIFFGFINKISRRKK